MILFKQEVYTKIKIHSIDYRGSISNGPGIRIVLFVQGCTKRCAGCHNPSTWNVENGKEEDIEDLVNSITNTSKIRKITISGGEPLLQKESIVYLVNLLKEKNFNVCLYTGFTIEEVPEELIKILDYLKVGDFQIDQKTSIDPYIGSKNQKFLTKGDLCNLKMQHQE